MFSSLKFFQKKFRHICQQTPLYGLTLLNRPFKELLFLPNDLWPGNIAFATSFINGNLNFNNKTLSLNDCLDCLSYPDKYPQSLVYFLHSFEWLRHLKTTSTNTSRKTVRYFILHWISANHRWANLSWHSSSWQADLIGARLYNWIALYDFFGNSADQTFRHSFFKSLSIQYCYLKRILDTLDNSFSKLCILKGLIYAACTIEKYRKNLSLFLNELEASIKKEILPDGTHISRSPFMQFTVLQDLVDIRSLLRIINSPQEYQFLHTAIHKMAPVLRLLRHNDGDLSELNSEVAFLPLNKEFPYITPHTVDMVLSLADVKGRPPTNLEEGGFERLNTRAGLVIIKKRLPPTSSRILKWEEIATQFFDFEWSAGRQRIIRRSDTIIQSSQNTFCNPSPHSKMQINKTKSYKKDGQSYLLMEGEYLNKEVLFKHSRELYLGLEEGDFRGEDHLYLSIKGTCITRFIFSDNIKILDYGTQSARLKIDFSPSLSPSKELTESHSQYWRFSSNGHDEIFFNPKVHIPFPSIFLITTLNSQEEKNLKWSFYLES